VLAPLFFASVLARNGKLAESEQVISEVESDVSEFEDPLVQVSQRMIRATLLESHGAFEDALQLVGQVEATYHQAGLVLGMLWARVYRGRLLLLTGRVRAGRACLDELTRIAGEHGARVIARLARDALRADPLQALAHGAGPSTRPGEVRRGGAIAAIQAVTEGRLEIARGYVVGLEIDGTLDPLSAALLDVVRAALAPTTDRVALYERALTAAAAAGADPELIPAIAARVAIVPGAADEIAIVIDTVHHELRCGDRVIALARRPASGGCCTRWPPISAARTTRSRWSADLERELPAIPSRRRAVGEHQAAARGPARKPGSASSPATTAIVCAIDEGHALRTTE